MENHKKPSIAIVDPNTLAVLGLAHLIESVMPMIEIDSYGSFAELEASHPEHYFHYFVDMRVVLSHMEFFQAQRHKTIVLSCSLDDGSTSLGMFHTLCVNQPEKQLLRSLLMLEQHAHAHGRNLPPMAMNGNVHARVLPHGRMSSVQRVEGNGDTSQLSQREIEVMSLVVKGLINKEIADRLNLSLPTIVSHRKNVMAKLGVRSVSALTIYAVMHGYVDVNDI